MQVDKYYQYYLEHYQGTNWKWYGLNNSSPYSFDVFNDYLTKAQHLGVLNELVRIEFLNLFYYPVLMYKKKSQTIVWIFNFIYMI